MTERQYPESALARARDGAIEWLENNIDGYPRSWEQEALHDKRRGYVMYDDFEAPPIAGYEALEREGRVVRLERTVRKDGEERIHFRSVTTDGERATDEQSAAETLEELEKLDPAGMGLRR